MTSRTRARLCRPQNGELTAAQVERFIAVQTRVRNELDNKWDRDREEVGGDSRQGRQQQQRLDAQRIHGSVFSDIANDLPRWPQGAGQSRSTSQRFSEAEYEWVRRRVYEAAGVELAGSIDLSKIEDAGARQRRVRTA